MRLSNYFSCRNTWRGCACTFSPSYLFHEYVNLCVPIVIALLHYFGKWLFPLLEFFLFGSFDNTAFSVCFVFYDVPCCFSWLRTCSHIYKKVIYYFWISTWSIGHSFSWTRNRPRRWATFLVLWPGRMLCLEFFFLIWSRKGALVNLNEPATVEAVSCYDLEIIF